MANVTIDRMLSAIGYYLSPIGIFHNSADPLLFLSGVLGLNLLAFSISPAVGVPILIALLVAFGVISVYRLQRQIEEHGRREDVLHNLSRLMNIGVMSTFNVPSASVARDKWNAEVVDFLGEQLGGNYQARWVRTMARWVNEPNITNRVERMHQDQLDLLSEFIKELTDPSVRPRRVVIPAEKKD